MLLYFNNCDAGVRIGDTLNNPMAYADDITLFSTNVQDLQNLIDVCDAYSKRWRFKFGAEKSKCMIVGKRPRGRPRGRWTDCVRRDMQALRITPEDAQDRTFWKSRIRAADPTYSGKRRRMIVGKCSLYQDPKWRLGDNCL